MKSFTVNQPANLKQFTDCTYPQGSFAFNALLSKGDIRVNGIKKREDCTLSAGDLVTYYTTPAQEAKPSHYVVFEDDNVLVADKLSGVSSEGLFCELSDRAGYPVHRLDRNTQGLIVLARSESVQKNLECAFKDRAVEKVYYCLAVNNFKNDSGSLTAYLEKDSEKGLVKVYMAPNRKTAEIKTDYEVVERYGDIALVKVILHTGRTHQIRAHLAFIGCPVLGDTRYGDFAVNKKYKLTRQQLVAKKLIFHLGGELAYLNQLKLESRFFPDFAKIIH